MREKLIELISYFGDCLTTEQREIVPNTRVVEIADHLLANGVTIVLDIIVGKWIPVTERLPEEECRCLVIDAAGDIEMDCYDGKGRFVLDRSGAVQHPSHWMPLPEPPKEE